MRQKDKRLSAFRDLADHVVRRVGRNEYVRFALMRGGFSAARAAERRDFFYRFVVTAVDDYFIFSANSPSDTGGSVKTLPYPAFSPSVSSAVNELAPSP